MFLSQHQQSLRPVFSEFHILLQAIRQSWQLDCYDHIAVAQLHLLVVSVANKRKMVPLSSISFDTIKWCQRLPKLRHTSVLNQVVNVGEPPL